MNKIKYLAAAFALLFALSVNMAPAMASSHDKDKSSKYEQQDKNKSDENKSDKNKSDRAKDKNKAGDKRDKKMDKSDQDDGAKGMTDDESKSEKKKWWQF